MKSLIAMHFVLYSWARRYDIPTTVTTKIDWKIWLIIINGLVFMVMHSTDLNITTAIYFIMGVIFSMTYLKHKNLGDSVAVHILNNAFTILV